MILLEKHRKPKKFEFFIKKFKKQFGLQMMVIPVVIFLILFRYLPMTGIQIAFKDYKIYKGIWNSDWVGLKYFYEFFTDPNVYKSLINTVGISVLGILAGFPFPILLAVSLCEVRNIRYKRVLQTCSYLPHFIASPIVMLLFSIWLSPSTGLINNILTALGLIEKPIFFLGDANLFWGVSVFIDLWRSAGWGSIIYIAAITGIDSSLYEAAVMDGAGRIKRIWHITLPGIKPTIMMKLILSGSSIINGASFDTSFLLGNSLNMKRSQILSVYTYSVGMELGRFSYSTAVSLLLSIVGLLLVLGVNKLSKVLADESFF